MYLNKDQPEESISFCLRVQQDSVLYVQFEKSLELEQNNSGHVCIQSQLDCQWHLIPLLGCFLLDMFCLENRIAEVGGWMTRYKVDREDK